MSISRHANILGALALGLAEDIIDGVTGGSKLGATETAALALIDHEPGISINALRGGLALSHPGAVRLVDRLVDAGFMQRARHEGDGRAVALSLTSAGATACAAAIAGRDGAIARGLAALTPEEQGMMGALAAKMLRAMLRDEAHAYRTCRLCHFERCANCPIEAELEARGG